MKRILVRILTIVITQFAAFSPASSQEVGIVSGRVLDRDTRRPIPDVLVTIAGARPTLTNGEGYFAVADVAAGPNRLLLTHITYGEHSQNVIVQRGTEFSVEIRLSAQAIELAPFVVETRSELEERRVSSGSGINEITRDEIEAASRAGMRMADLVQTMPGTMTSGSSTGRTCVMYRAIRSGGRTGCREVSVILDGVPVASPSYLYNTMPLNDIERMEMLSPGEAGVRYGMASGQAVLLIETRRGPTEVQRDASRFVTGFNWMDEGRSYAWLRVLGSAAVVNALGVGLGMTMAQECLWSPEEGALGLRTRCNGLATASSGLLTVAVPAVLNAVVARRMGGTPRTHGRIVPTAIASGMTLTAGYILVIHGADATKAAGIGVLAVGVPLTVALADRIFRVLR